MRVMPTASRQRQATFVAQPRLPSEAQARRPKDLRSRMSRALAKYIPSRRVAMRNSGPLVSFTFDDVPDSALHNGAAILEQYGVKGTFYIAPGTCGLKDDHWRVIGRDELAGLHRRGHEIGCHTHSHVSVQTLDHAGLAREIDETTQAITDICGAPPSRNFAYPFGVASWSRKLQLQRSYDSCRGTYEGINNGRIDLGHLRAIELYDRTLDAARLARLLDETVAKNGWLIFFAHDVADPPSWIGCSPALLRLVVNECRRRHISCVTVEEALRDIAG